MTAIKAGSQAARILHALANGRWTSVAEIHRHAGTSTSFSARITQLRKAGWKIEHQTVKGKARPTLASQYRLAKPWPVKELPDSGVKKVRKTLNRDATPRDKAHRFRIYAVDEENSLLLLGTAPTESKLGVEICRLAREGIIEQKDCLGLLDTFGVDESVIKGQWLLNPFDPRTV